MTVARTNTLVVHVGCMPFPSYQGTQAAIGQMLEVATSSGRDTRLVTYARAAYPCTGAFTVDRLPDVPTDRSLRSGPSLRKLALDAAMVAKVRSIDKHLRPKAYFAHHIEAACAVLAAGARPVIYVAHTSLEAELPYYFSRLDRLARAAGRIGDRVGCRAATVAAAISPQMTASLSSGTKPLRYLPIPWRISPTANEHERARARVALGLEETDRVLLYAGNLDAYQGWEDIVRATALLHNDLPLVRLLVATESSVGPLTNLARQLGIERALRITTLRGETARRQAHAAADIATIPRRAPGGLPIKLLESLSRGIPTIATQRARAGLALGPSCMSVIDDSPLAIATAARDLFGDRQKRHALAAQGRLYIAREHSDEKFLSAYDALIECATGARSWPPRPGVAEHRAPQTPPTCTIGKHRAPPSIEARRLGIPHGTR